MQRVYIVGFTMKRFNIVNSWNGFVRLNYEPFNYVGLCLIKGLRENSSIIPFKNVEDMGIVEEVF